MMIRDAFRSPVKQRARTFVRSTVMTGQISGQSGMTGENSYYRFFAHIFAQMNFSGQMPGH